MTLMPVSGRHSLLLALLSLASLGSSPVHGNSQDPATAVVLPSGEDSSATLVTLTHDKTPATPGEVMDYEFYKRLQDLNNNNNNIGKRAYSYVSEYKRLPVYNFGLGKRSQSQLYSFGLGKRSPPQGGRTYSFGLGKRSDDYDDTTYGSEEGNDDDQVEVPDEEDDEVEDVMEKRNRLYSFGLGKRLKTYSFGLGKRYGGDNQRLYSFGLGKRSPRPASAMYGFGLGKRPSHSQSSRFSFGLGKRGDEVVDEMIDEGKRSAGDHRFSFGLGKREISASELQALEEGVVGGDDNKGSTTKTTRTKRSLHYGFGLGKRTRYEQESDRDHLDDLTRYARRPYSFGLGKRVPMYDFGIGKRSEG